MGSIPTTGTMEFELQQTNAWCGNVRADNAFECRRQMGHTGFHADKRNANLWLDLDELPRTWSHSTQETWHHFWLSAAAPQRAMLT